MSEYARRFAENDIDFAILGDLTDQDFEKIGVVSLGHRRKLLRAICRPQEERSSRQELHEVARKETNGTASAQSLIRLPNGSQFSPLNFESCICRIGK